MLKEIYIENLAVIRQSAILITKGFNAFTGETGAGKSILVGGINAVLGQRVTKEIVRTGAEKALVSALFCGLPESVSQKLEELGFSARDGELQLTREINSDGGSTARLNGRSVTVSVLREIGELLINIHGQHDNQILMSPERHLGILDSFGECEPLIKNYRESFQSLQRCAKKLAELKKGNEQSRFKSKELAETVEELSKMKLRPNEDELIEKEYEVISNAAFIRTSIEGAYSLLNADGNAFDIMREAQSELEKIQQFTTDTDEICKRVESVKIEIKDIAEELHAAARGFEFDENRFERIRERRSEIIKACKKYQTDVNGLIEILGNAEAELDNIGGFEFETDKLLKERAELLAKTTEHAKALSEYREKMLAEFIRRVTAELEFLNMPNVVLAADMQKGKLTSNGMDTLEFLISANRGETPKPIAKIASGGELSRIMLALKCVLAEKDDIPTLIFDEIDAGVSGKAAQKIGIKLAQLSKTRQVICVTHLAQIASKADNHLLIEKNADVSHTETSVVKLDHNGRVAEIARIISGDGVTATVLKSAEELLSN